MYKANNWVRIAPDTDQNDSKKDKYDSPTSAVIFFLI